MAPPVNVSVVPVIAPVPLAAVPAKAAGVKPPSVELLHVETVKPSLPVVATSTSHSTLSEPRRILIRGCVPAAAMAAL